MNETNENDKVEAKVSELLRQVSDVTGIPMGAIVGQRRKRGICAARFMAMAMLRYHFPLLALVEIAEMMGKRDHSTMYYGICRYRELYRHNSAFRHAATKLGLPEQIY